MINKTLLYFLGSGLATFLFGLLSYFIYGYFKSLSNKSESVKEALNNRINDVNNRMASIDDQFTDVMKFVMEKISSWDEKNQSFFRTLVYDIEANKLNIEDKSHINMETYEKLVRDFNTVRKKDIGEIKDKIKTVKIEVNNLTEKFFVVEKHDRVIKYNKQEFDNIQKQINNIKLSIDKLTEDIEHKFQQNELLMSKTHQLLVKLNDRTLSNEKRIKMIEKIGSGKIILKD